MDRTLRDYLNGADEIHQMLENDASAVRIDLLEEKMLELQTNIRNIQSISKRIADVSNLLNYNITRRKSKRNIKHVETYPRDTDHSVMRIVYPQPAAEILPGISLPIRIVNRASDIPVSHLYYVRETKQYAMNIAGVNVEGGLANLVDYRAKKSSMCEYGISCKTLKRDKQCDYYHRPEDYIKLGIPVPDFNIRSFTIGSWLYSSNKNPKTYYARHVGGINTIIDDLKCLPRLQYTNEIDNREGQLMHDIMVYLILIRCGYIDKFKHWQPRNNAFLGNLT